MTIINGELFLKRFRYPFEDYSKIYQVAINEDGVFLRTRDNDGELSDFKKTDISNIEENYIPLTSYLLNAKYLGIPAEVNCVNWDHVQEFITGVILYKNREYILVYDMEPIGLSKKVLPLKVISNENFVSYVNMGEATDIYSDPKELYHDLFIEILETTKDINNNGKQK